MLFFLRDQALVRLLNDCRVRVVDARSNADLLEVLDRLDMFPGGLEFDHVQAISLLLLAFASLAAAVLLDGMGGLFWLFLILCFCSYRVSKRVSGSSTDLAASIVRKCVLFGHGLSECDSSADWRLKRLNSEFRDYRRGNERRHIVDSFQGVSQGARHSLAFEYHHLQYVNTIRGHGASGDDITVYQTYSRYSLVLDFPWVKEIAVRSSPLELPLAGQPFKTGNDDFDQAFVLRGNDQASCDCFATPATISLLMDLSHLLYRVNLEFSSGGRLCLSFDNPDIMAHTDLGGLSDLSAFRERIRGGIELPMLYPLLELIHRLAQLHDSHVVDASPEVSDAVELT